jgi:hypothetical protein
MQARSNFDSHRVIFALVEFASGGNSAVERCCEVSRRIRRVNEVVHRIVDVVILLTDGLEPELEAKAFGELRRLSLRFWLVTWFGR